MYLKFAFIVVNRPHYSRMVRSLDISKFQNARGKEGKLMEMVGWREFKYRHHQMFEVFGRFSYGPSFYTCLPYRYLEEQRTRGQPFSLSSSTHPTLSPLLSSFHHSRDILIGIMYHVLGACTRINASICLGFI
ncbi:hypothetical protein F5882DRAFT_397756 [Hyaloscypha sp. PMI_1271]|nr:hypothetical protein F5882DRAFT_397756 [Hyaloscypha sp. PMI_1271]